MRAVDDIEELDESVGLWLALDDTLALLDALCERALERDGLNDAAAEREVVTIAVTVAVGDIEGLNDDSMENDFIKDIDGAALVDSRGLLDADAERDSCELADECGVGDEFTVEAAVAAADALTEDMALKLASIDFDREWRLDSVTLTSAEAVAECRLEKD